MAINNHAHELTFDDFRSLAKNKTLSDYQKIGFPDFYRKNFAKTIVNDIVTKLFPSNASGGVVMDIGCGCSDIVNELAIFTNNNNKTLILIDSQEMLDQCSISNNGLIKIPGKFPHIPYVQKKYSNHIDAILVYSVIHYVFAEGDLYNFLHKTLDLLSVGGRMLIGDIPNVSKRDRFLKTQEGVKFIKNSPSNLKGATNHQDTSQKIDDSIVFAIMQRFRNYGHEAYLLPQDISLPMSNRREDILIVKNL